MRILFLAQVLPFPLDAGPKIRAYYVIRHLVEVGHQVTLLSFVRKTDRPEHLQHLQRYCEEVRVVPIQRSFVRDGLNVCRSVVSSLPFLVIRDQVPAMRNAVRSMVEATRFDAIHADQLWMAPYAQLARRCSPQRSGPFLVLDQHNAVFQIPERLAAHEANPLKRRLLTLEAKKMARYERDACRRFDKVVWVTEEDRRAVGAMASAAEAGSPSGMVIPICVEAPASRLRKTALTRNRMTFIGGLNWPPNLGGVLWFIQKIWPSIKSRDPKSVLTIIGRDGDRRLADVRDSRVEITGYVSDPTRFLEDTAVFIVPLLAGGGMRVKILDAWQYGIPVVSTRIGAEGISVRQRENLILADQPEEFASAAVEVARFPNLAARLVRGGYRTLESSYNWRDVYRAWDRIYPCESFSLSRTRQA